MGMSLFDIRRILEPEKITEPEDDIRIIDSWAEYEYAPGKAPGKRGLQYLCYEMETMNPATGERIRFYKAIKFLKVERLPASAKQSTAFMDMQSQILSAVWENGYNLVTIIANIVRPVAIGLLYVEGVQGVSASLQEAKRKADMDFRGLRASLQGTFRVLEMRVLQCEETEWLKERIGGMKFLTSVRGIPKANKSGEDGGNKGVGGKNVNPDSMGTLEELITGLCDYEYVIEILSTPVYRDTLEGWQRKYQKEMTEWYSRMQGTTSLSMNLSIPMSYVANSSQAQGWSRSYSDSTTVSYAQGEDFSHTEGTSVGESLSQSYSHGVSYSEGQSYSQGSSHGYSITNGVSTTESQSVSVGESFNESSGLSMGNSQNYSLGSSSGISHNVSDGTSTGLSHNTSSGISSGMNSSHSTGTSESSSHSTGTSESTGYSSSSGTSTGVSYSQGHGTSSSSSYGQSVTEGSSIGHNVGTSQSVGYSQSQSSSIGNSVNVGQSASVSQSQSQGYSSGVGTSYNTSNSAGLNYSSSTGSSSGYSYGEQGSVGLRGGMSAFGGSATSGTSDSYSTGTSSSTSSGGNVSSSVGYGVNASQSASSSSSVGATYGASVSQGSSQSYSQGSGISQSTGVSEGYSEGQSISYGQTASSTTGTSQNESYGMTAGQSFTEGYSASQGVNQTDSYGQGSSTSDSTGYSTGTSSSTSDGYSLGTSSSTSDGYSSGTSSSVSNGTSYSYSSSSSYGSNYSESASTSYGQSYSEGESSSVSSTEGRSISNGTSDSQSVGTGQNWGTSSSDSTGTSSTVSNGQSTGTSLGSTGTSSFGTATTMGLGPSIGYNKSHQWLDQGVKDLIELMEYQNNRLKNALRQNGAFYTYVYICCPTEECMRTAQAVAKSTWHNADAMVQPLQVLDLTEREQRHLLHHAAAFSGDVTKEYDGMNESFKYCSVLLPSEYAAYTHLPRVSEGGVFATIEDIPKFSVPGRLDGEIYMGNVMNTERYSWENGYNTQFDYRIPETALLHGYFTGASRSGKTVAAMRFIKELAQCKRSKTGKRVRIVVLDPKQDWRKLARYVEPERFRFASMGNPNFNPIKINPWKIPEGVEPQFWIDGVINIYCRAYGFLERGKQMLSDVIFGLYEKAGVFGTKNPDTGIREDLSDRSRIPELSAKVNFAAIYKAFEQKREELENGPKGGSRMGNDTKDAYARILERLSCFNREYSTEYRLYGTSDGLGIDELIGDDDVTVLESKGLESTFNNFIFGVIVSGFYKYALSHDGGFLSENQYETVLVVEEANEVLTGNDDASGKSGGSLKGESEFEQVLDQAAGYGLFIISITQKVGMMPSSVTANAGIVFAGRLQTPTDVQTVMNAFGKDERIDDKDLKKWIPNIPVGWFIVKTSRSRDWKSQHPVLVNIAPLPGTTPSNSEITYLQCMGRADKSMSRIS